LRLQIADRKLQKKKVTLGTSFPTLFFQLTSERGRWLMGLLFFE